MILPFEPYNPVWNVLFLDLENELNLVCKNIEVQIDHIGSTSVEGLSAKPIIDIQLGVEKESYLDEIIASLLQLPNVVYYEKYNENMPLRRFFVMFNRSTKEMGVSPIVRLNQGISEILHNHNLRIAHIHTFVKNSPDWIRHIAFRNYLRTHPKVKNAYQTLKQKLIESSWKDGNEYNEAKDDFLKENEKNAVEWYKRTIHQVK